MPINNRYPKIRIRSKNELVHSLVDSHLIYDDALALINDVCENFDLYWKDNKWHSEPKKHKYVRNAKYTPLGKLLRRINERLLSPHDSKLPNYIFGGVTGLSNVDAALYLLGSKGFRRRSLLTLDITRFFEQVSEGRVKNFFLSKCQCNDRGARLLAKLCCIEEGVKGSGLTRKTLARGFPTSSRLAIWCNLDIFIKLDYLVKKRLKGHNPRLSIYVDDIGITASKVDNETLQLLASEIEKLLMTSDVFQPLPLNQSKTRIMEHSTGLYHLGLKMLKNRLDIGPKTQAKLAKNKNLGQEKRPSVRGSQRYKDMVRSAHKNSKN